MLVDQQQRDRKNIQFWNELCGSSLARSLGITEINSETLQKFDKAYMDYYPYLAGYVLKENLKSKRVLEIGLGYGTLSSLIASRDPDYYGLDIAYGPVKMIAYRLALAGQRNTLKAQEGSVLALPYRDRSFDYVYSIGCLHHTGDLAMAVSEVHRVLKPGGKAIVMLYHRHSFRQLMDVPWVRIKYHLSSRSTHKNMREQVRALYDTNAKGEAAPHTDYVSRAQVRQLFKRFSRLQVDVQNFDPYSFWKGKIVIRREWLLNNLARVLGLDLYIVATK